MGVQPAGARLGQHRSHLDRRDPHRPVVVRAGVCPGRGRGRAGPGGVRDGGHERRLAAGLEPVVQALHADRLPRHGDHRQLLHDRRLPAVRAVRARGHRARSGRTRELRDRHRTRVRIDVDPRRGAVGGGVEPARGRDGRQHVHPLDRQCARHRCVRQHRQHDTRVVLPESAAGSCREAAALGRLRVARVQRPQSRPGGRRLHQACALRGFAPDLLGAGRGGRHRPAHPVAVAAPGAATRLPRRPARVRVRRLPLDGMLVVALEQAVAAPLASRHLADLGARVVKLERVDGGDFARYYDHAVKGIASHFVWLNRGKESVAVDLKTAAGREILARLLAKADVFLHNLGPGAVDRLGFSSAALREQHPRLVVCAMSGYGSTGPYRDKRAYDLLVQSEAALVAVTGTPDHPAKAGIPVADIASGMYAFGNILAALIHRERTGEGTAFEITMFDALVEWMGHPIYATDHTGEAPPRVGLSHPVIAPYDAYPTADGHEVVIGIQNDREWVRLATDILGRPELATDPDFATNVARVRNRDRVDEAVAEALGKLAAADAVTALDAARIASARLNEVQDLIAHPQLVARDRWRSAPTPVGDVRVLRSPMEPVGEGPTGGVPALGADTAAVLSELGYSSAQIQSMHADAAVFTDPPG